jgi:hypothetical protein
MVLKYFKDIVLVGNLGNIDFLISRDSVTRLICEIDTLALDVGSKNGTVTDVETLCPRGKYCPRFLATLHVLYYEVRQGRAGVNLRGGQISCTVQSYANSLYWKFLR